MLSKIIKINPTKPSSKLIIICLIMIITTCTGVFFYNYRYSGYAVKYNGMIVGYTKEMESTSKVLDSLKDELRKVDQSISISDQLQFEKMHLEDNRITDSDSIKESLKSILYSFYTSYAITVNNKEMAVVRSESEAQKVLDEIKRHFIEADSKDGVQVTEVSIKDVIRVSPRITNPLIAVEWKTAVELLLSAKGENKKYDVKQGDSLWRIASNCNMKVEELVAINPNINAEALQIGQAINVSVSEPFLNVETTVMASSDEEIPPDITYVNDDNLYTGDTKVIESGQNGVNRIVKQIKKLNGREVVSAVLSTSVIKSPVTKVMARGTKIMIGSGQIQWPIVGELCSYFGSRGGQHKGIDIIADMGDPIYAADSGVVIFARNGWNGGYGNKVEISHGNGYTTIYAHCSTLSVVEGQSVARGQRIASIGSTGDSIGPHLHFEVRLNDRPQNPLKFLK